MFRGLTVAVVVPAFNEADKIERTLQSLPRLCDHVIVVDDASRDGTAARVRAGTVPGVRLLRHERNRGVGAAIATGYREALRLGVDVAIVMAGDGQMDPADAPALLEPIARGEADYTKGNRFLHEDLLRVMPWTRISGNWALSLAARVASGYWNVFDTQCGFTAASRAALVAIDPDRMFARYGYPIDVLGRLAVARIRVADVRCRPIYGPAWRSGIRPWTLLHPIPFILICALARRLAARVRGRSVLPAPLAQSDGSCVSE